MSSTRDGTALGHVDAFLVDDEGRLTHLVLERATAASPVFLPGSISEQCARFAAAR